MFVHFVSRDCDPIVASRVCEKAVAIKVRRPGERQRFPLHSGAAIQHDGLLRIIEQMETHLDEPIAQKDVAASNCLSRRQIERIFLDDRRHDITLICGSSGPICSLSILRCQSSR